MTKCDTNIYFSLNQVVYYKKKLKKCGGGEGENTDTDTIKTDLSD